MHVPWLIGFHLKVTHRVVPYRMNDNSEEDSFCKKENRPRKFGNDSINGKTLLTNNSHVDNNPKYNLTK